MLDSLRKSIGLLPCELLVVLPQLSADPRGRVKNPSAVVESNSPGDYLQKPYVELFEIAPTLRFTPAEIEGQRKSLKSGQDFCVNQFKNHAKPYAGQVDATQEELRQETGKIADEEWRQIHGHNQNLDLLKSEAQTLSGHAVPAAYENLNAKLDVIEKWSAARQQIERQFADGSNNQRRRSDVKDIGLRIACEGGCEPPKKLEYKPGQPIEDLCAAVSQDNRN